MVPQSTLGVDTINISAMSASSKQYHMMLAQRTIFIT
jgi:hypothetical protein